MHWFGIECFLLLFFYSFLLSSKRNHFDVPPKEFVKLIFVGFLIAIHWIFFFKAIHISNVSITLAVFSLGAFFASFLEPLFYGRKVLWYEVFFGLVIIAGLGIILQVEMNYFEGMMYALASDNYWRLVYTYEWKIDRKTRIFRYYFL